MYKIISGIFFFVSLMFTGLLTQAQDSLQKEKPQMAELMRSNGKIYVVVTVLVIILAGLFIYLVNLDRKLGKLEKEK